MLTENDIKYLRITYKLNVDIHFTLADNLKEQKAIPIVVVAKRTTFWDLLKHKLDSRNTISTQYNQAQQNMPRFRE